VSPEQAEQIIEEQGLTPGNDGVLHPLTADDAATFVDSFDGPSAITGRWSSRGRASSATLFRRAMSRPSTAFPELRLADEVAGAVGVIHAAFRRIVTANARAFVLEGPIRNGVVEQTLVLDPSAFTFSLGEPYYPLPALTGGPWWNRS
jgi:hypothetical protein